MEVSNMRNKIYLTGLVLCGLFIVFVPSLTNAQFNTNFDQKIQSILKHWKAPGVTISVVKNGEVLLAKGFGNTRVDGGVPVTDQTLTSIASVTKPFTATAVGMLIDDGLLNWDDPVIKHIPEFRFAEKYRNENITIRDLLTHRSGLPGLLGGLYDTDYSIKDIFAELPNKEPRIDFRQRLDYSQVGIALVGEIIGRVSGSSWSNFIKSRIFAPLKMESSFSGTKDFFTFYPEVDKIKNLMGRFVKKDDKVIDGLWRGINNAYNSAGGIVTISQDMTKYMLLILNDGLINGQRLISSESIKEILKPHEVENSPYGPIINPRAKIIAYCMGWIAHEYDGMKIVEHPGSNFGSSVVALIPEKNLGVFISSGASYSLESDKMVSAIKLTIIDHALNIKPKEWIKIFSLTK